MKNNICVDAGGMYCPCYLSQTGDCILCAILKEEEFCNCAWQGLCIYQNYIKNNNNISLQRESILCEITNIENIRENLSIIKIKIPHKMALNLIQPGAYVLLRGENNDEDKFNTPISVMDVNLDEDELSLVIKEIGAKTKLIMKNKHVYIKGAYLNGIFGLKYLKMKDKKAILISKGLSQVSLVNVAKNLLKNNNDVKVYIDESGCKIKAVEDILNSMNLEVKTINFDEGKDEIKKTISESDFVFSASTDSFNKKVMDMLDDDKSFAITNNNKICCGEGLCGSCIIDINGEKIKTCKTQIDSRVYLKEALKWQK